MAEPDFNSPFGRETTAEATVARLGRFSQVVSGLARELAGFGNDEERPPQIVLVESHSDLRGPHDLLMLLALQPGQPLVSRAGRTSASSGSLQTGLLAFSICMYGYPISTTRPGTLMGKVLG